MIATLALAVALICQTPAPAVIAPATPAAGTADTTGAPRVPPPEAVDLAARLRAARAGNKPAETPGRQAAVPDDGRMRCHQTADGVSCGNDEEFMRRTAEENRRRAEELMNRPN